MDQYDTLPINKNNKIKNDQIVKYLGIPFPTLLRCYGPLLGVSATGGYTLIPRVTTANIRVCVFPVDMRMGNSQRGHTRMFHHSSRTNNNNNYNNYTTNNHTINNNSNDMHIAAYNGNVARVRELVQGNEGLIRHKDSDGNIPLHIAVENGHQEVALYLIKEFPQGSYALNHLEKSPIYLAVVKGHKNLVDKMLEHLAGDATVIDRLNEGKSIIFAAVQAQNHEMVQTIIYHQPKLMIKSVNKDGYTPLSYASYNGFTDTITFFLQTFPEFVHKDMTFPIHKACLGGHIKVLEMFHAHCPRLFTKPDQNGLNILHHAAKEPRNRLKDVVSYLLELQESRILVKMKDETNRIPFDLARNSKNDQVMELILSFHQRMRH